MDSSSAHSTGAGHPRQDLKSDIGRLVLYGAGAGFTNDAFGMPGDLMLDDDFGLSHLQHRSGQLQLPQLDFDDGDGIGSQFPAHLAPSNSNGPPASPLLHAMQRGGLMAQPPSPAAGRGRSDSFGLGTVHGQNPAGNDVAAANPAGFISTALSNTGEMLASGMQRLLGWGGTGAPPPAPQQQQVGPHGLHTHAGIPTSLPMTTASPSVFEHARMSAGTPVEGSSLAAFGGHNTNHMGVPQYPAFHQHAGVTPAGMVARRAQAVGNVTMGSRAGAGPYGAGAGMEYSSSGSFGAGQLARPPHGGMAATFQATGAAVGPGLQPFLMAGRGRQSQSQSGVTVASHSAGAGTGTGSGKQPAKAAARGGRKRAAKDRDAGAADDDLGDSQASKSRKSESALDRPLYEDVDADGSSSGGAGPLVMPPIQQQHAGIGHPEAAGASGQMYAAAAHMQVPWGASSLGGVAGPQAVMGGSGPAAAQLAQQAVGQPALAGQGGKGKAAMRQGSTANGRQVAAPGAISAAAPAAPSAGSGAGGPIAVPQGAASTAASVAGAGAAGGLQAMLSGGLESNLEALLKARGDPTRSGAIQAPFPAAAAVAATTGPSHGGGKGKGGHVAAPVPAPAPAPAKAKSGKRGKAAAADTSVELGNSGALPTAAAPAPPSPPTQNAAGAAQAAANAANNATAATTAAAAATAAREAALKAAVFAQLQQQTKQLDSLIAENAALREQLRRMEMGIDHPHAGAAGPSGAAAAAGTGLSTAGASAGAGAVPGHERPVSALAAVVRVDEDERQAQLGRLLTMVQEGASDDALAKAMQEYKDVWGDFGKERWNALRYHMRSLRASLLPNQITRMCMWSIENSDPQAGAQQAAGGGASSSSTPGRFGHLDVPEPGQVWQRIADACEISPEQTRKMLELKGSVGNARRDFAETLSLLRGLEEKVTQHFGTLEFHMTALMVILTPRQAALFLEWMERNRHLFTALPSLAWWPHRAPGEPEVPETAPGVAGASSAARPAAVVPAAQSAGSATSSAAATAGPVGAVASLAALMPAVFSAALGGVTGAGPKPAAAAATAGAAAAPALAAHGLRPLHPLAASDASAAAAAAAPTLLSTTSAGSGMALGSARTTAATAAQGSPLSARKAQAGGTPGAAAAPLSAQQPKSQRAPAAAAASNAADVEQADASPSSSSSSSSSSGPQASTSDEEMGTTTDGEAEASGDPTSIPRIC